MPGPSVAIAASFDVDRVLRAKQRRTVAVVLPARNEETTVGPIVETIRTRLMSNPLRVGGPVVDDLVVMDDQSTDRTAEIARAAGARVVATADVEPTLAPGPGKGEAMWKSLLVTDADIVCWCDADVVEFDGSYVLGLVGTLCEADGAVMAKGHYRRPVVGHNGDQIGGRVTELVARPLIGLLHAELSGFPQPLSGEIAVVRSAIESLPICRGYAVDLGLLIDVAEAHGADSIHPVDLGARCHRPQNLMALGAMSATITAMVLRRAGLDVPASVDLQQPNGRRVVTTSDPDLPPINTVHRR